MYIHTYIHTYVYTYIHTYIQVIFCEETEKGMIELFNDHGFDCITLPFRNVFEFGGSFHCVTTDIRRRGHMKSYFKAIDAAEAPNSQKSLI
jgi:hypothetical protein